MRKRRFINIFFLFLLFSSLANLTRAQSLKFEYRTGYFSPKESVIREVYDKGWLNYFEFGLIGNFGERHALEVYASVKDFSQSGQLTYTKENTDLDILTFGFGARYTIDVLSQLVFPYAGVGLNYNRFDEKNVLAQTTVYEIGYEFQGGVYLRPFKGTMNIILVDLYFNFSSCPMKSDQRNLNIGGWTIGVGLGFEY